MNHPQRFTHLLQLVTAAHTRGALGIQVSLPDLAAECNVTRATLWRRLRALSRQEPVGAGWLVVLRYHVDGRQVVEVVDREAGRDLLVCYAGELAMRHRDEVWSVRHVRRLLRLAEVRETHADNCTVLPSQVLVLLQRAASLDELLIAELRELADSRFTAVAEQLAALKRCRDVEVDAGRPAPVAPRVVEKPARTARARRNTDG